MAHNGAGPLADDTSGRTSGARLAAVVAAVGGSVRDDDHLATLLQRTAELAQDAVGGASACGISILFGGMTYTAVHTADLTLRVDTHQYEVGEGPCLEAARTGETVRMGIDDVTRHWPDFAHRSAGEGVASFLAVPLRVDGADLGSINLYSTEPGAFDADDEAVLRVITETVATAIGDYARVRSAREVATGLRDALDHRAPIEQAKGILMALHGVDEDEAFAMLSRDSQHRNRKLRDIAREFVDKVSGDQVSGDGDSAAPS
ncbi:GAF and ANTAR domain-containing protein [Rhodococcoides corynebacterioides]|uniref:GAF and ANTAR domain-containing protein n=1 Tax=Rhodococcoides corynebacterioides TaxID=53972 RepID=A0ABS7P381_9NOCA|nr:GAF and ANTAR domain-containing protein [Rhodococcus corynebacterioides]MBY6366873.1 GAF and ANTAR domain-containing protein [Rhodococcus corynebacterioides]MBY6409156.1 GAF and ANTAR domain-containing protein [Rhodococcus corynebacterioides]